jgi:hypothetical protein
MSGHAKCRKNDGKLPPRVIDVGSEHDALPIRLLTTEGRPGCYVTLSHCWGGHACLSTTRANLEEHQQCIEFERLPPTFKDAITTTRKLAFQYLWIDSLCIVQDDLDDWSFHARIMGTIYENALCTIAATRSPSSEYTFLEPRNKTWLACRNQELNIVKFPCDTNNPRHGYMFFNNYRNFYPSQNLQNARLNQRGWVLQERLLSRRILHFTVEQVYWECKTHLLGEDGTRYDIELDLDLNGVSQELESLARTFQSLRENSLSHKEIGNWRIQTTDEMPKVELSNLWCRIVEWYSKCGLTFLKDKLPALQGISERIKAFSGLIYMEGTFFDTRSTTLPRTLFWEAMASKRMKAEL